MIEMAESTRSENANVVEPLLTATATALTLLREADATAAHSFIAPEVAGFIRSFGPALFTALQGICFAIRGAATLSKTSCRYHADPHQCQHIHTVHCSIASALSLSLFLSLSHIWNTKT
jgi:hypothetical protein